MALFHVARVAAVLAVVSGVAACVDESPEKTYKTSAIARPAGTQPYQAVYRCGERGQLTVQNSATSVTLVDPDGDSVTLPAAPPAQRSRYGQTGYALILEGNDALYMRGGKVPVNCTR